MNKKLVIEALAAYRRTCGAEANRKRTFGDEEWKKWAEKGAEVEEMIGQIRSGELVFVEQQVLL
jgi:hypothetical protein